MVFFVLAAALAFTVAVLALVYKALQIMVDKRILHYQSDLLEKHCEEVQNMYRQTRGWRHDYHNHIQAMKAHLAMGRLAELERYLTDLDDDLRTVDTVVKTGNVMIDAILNSKLSLAKARGIAVDAEARVPEDLKGSVSEVELSMIIGNLLDNSMEACMKAADPSQRFIRVYIDALKGQLYVYVMNSVGEKLRKTGAGYASTKSSEGHGFGLMRIDRVVNRYHGYLERQDEEGVFVTEIMLPLAS